MNVFTKIKLYSRAWRDKKTDQFRPASYPLENGMTDEFSVSGFVEYELSQYVSDRAAALYEKRRFFLIRTKNGRFAYPRCRSFNDMLVQIDERVNVIQARIRMRFVAYNIDAQELERKKLKSAADGAPEYEQMYEAELEKRQKRLLKQVEPMYLAIIELLDKKVRRIGFMESKLKMLLAKRHDRINQYYFYASDDPKLPKKYYSYDRMAMIADISTIEPFRTQVEDAEKTSAAYHEEYNKLF